MTRPWSGEELARRISAKLPQAVEAWKDTSLWVKPESVRQVAQFLKEEPGLEFNFLNSISGVDFIDHFEVVYHLTSLKHNHSAVVKTRVPGRGEPAVPSVCDVWRGANYQEREVWDLLGIRFDGHPNLKRIMLWEDYPGHPLRKDYLEEL